MPSPLILDATHFPENAKEFIHSHLILKEAEEVELKDGTKLLSIKIFWDHDGTHAPFYFRLPEQNSRLISNLYADDFILPISLKSGKTSHVLKQMQEVIKEKLAIIKAPARFEKGLSKFSLYKEKKDYIQLYNKLPAYKPCINARTKNQVIIPKVGVFLNKVSMKDITELIDMPCYSYKVYTHFEQIWVSEKASGIRPYVFQTHVTPADDDEEIVEDEENDVD